MDQDGNVVLGGATDSADYPISEGALQTAPGGLFDATVTAIDPAGRALVYSTRFGGSSFDVIFGMTVLPGGAVLVMGDTGSAAILGRQIGATPERSALFTAVILNVPTPAPARTAARAAIARREVIFLQDFTQFAANPGTNNNSSSVSGRSVTPAPNNQCPGDTSPPGQNPPNTQPVAFYGAVNVFGSLTGAPVPTGGFQPMPGSVSDTYVFCFASRLTVPQPPTPPATGKVKLTITKKLVLRDTPPASGRSTVVFEVEVGGPVNQARNVKVVDEGFGFDAKEGCELNQLLLLSICQLEAKTGPQRIEFVASGVNFFNVFAENRAWVTWTNPDGTLDQASATAVMNEDAPRLPSNQEFNLDLTSTAGQLTANEPSDSTVSVNVHNPNGSLFATDAFNCSTPPCKKTGTVMYPPESNYVNADQSGDFIIVSVNGPAKLDTYNLTTGTMAATTQVNGTVIATAVSPGQDGFDSLIGVLIQNGAGCKTQTGKMSTVLDGTFSTMAMNSVTFPCNGMNDVFVGADGKTVLTTNANEFFLIQDNGAPQATEFPGSKVYHSGDVNMDGMTDFVIANLAEIRVYQGTGSGLMLGSTIPTAPFTVADVKLKDVNSDMCVDVVVVIQGLGAIATYPGDCNGNFGNPTGTGSRSGLANGRIADFNGDGVLDALAVNLNAATGSHTASVFFGKK